MRRKMILRSAFKKWASFAMIGAAVIGSSVAAAQEVVPPAKAAAPAAAKKKAPPRVIELEELVVEGRIQKPEVFYVLGKAKTRYTVEEKDNSFLDKIESTVDENPF